MRRKIREYIERERMILPGDTVLCGLSGGADSVCLFYILLDLREELSFALQAVHVNHNLRDAESDGDEAFVRGLCAREGIACWCYSYPVGRMARERGISLEEAGRLARQEAFKACMREHGANRLALAHHQNDMAETMLHHLCRGSSLAGLASLRPVRGAVIRPLLCAGREEIEAELRERGIPWREDSTNALDAYTRNGIRHHVIPFLTAEVNGAAVRHMAQTSADILEAEEYLTAQAAAWKERHTKRDASSLWISKALADCPELLKRYVLRLSIEELAGGRRDLTRTHLLETAALLEKETGRRICLPGGVRAVRTYDGLALLLPGKEEKGERALPEELAIPGPGSFSYGPYQVEIRRISGNFGGNPQNQYTKRLNCDIILDRLVLRTRRSGDYLVVNSRGGRKKLKDFMIDRKIPRSERDGILVLACGSEILWVVGYRVSERFRAADTGNQIQIQITGGYTNE